MKLNTLNNLFAASAVAAIVLCSPLVPSAQAAETGRIIGDGKVLPREYVPGRPAMQRVKEISQWMIDKGGTFFERKCTPAEKVCTEMVKLALTGGGTLMLVYYDYFDGRKDYYAYCKKAPTNDTLFCYNMQTAKYYGNMLDAATGKWETIYDQATEERKQQQQPTTPASDDTLL